jgi:hypothetical protein
MRRGQGSTCGGEQARRETPAAQRQRAEPPQHPGAQRGGSAGGERPEHVSAGAGRR